MATDVRVGAFVWAPHPRDGFARGVVVSEGSSAGSWRVRALSGSSFGPTDPAQWPGHQDGEWTCGNQGEVSENDLVSVGPLSDSNPFSEPTAAANCADLCTLDALTEPLLLEALKQRCGYNDAENSTISGMDEYSRAAARIYTRVGPVLVSVNPYGFAGTDIYSEAALERCFGKRLHEVDAPHVYALASSAHAALSDSGGKESQAIVVTGESGSGKTEATKYILQYLTFATTQRPGTKGKRISVFVDGSLEQRLLQTSFILEAFGNAKTVRNDNSSRFGKFVAIDFASATPQSPLAILGANIRTYLLEKSRIVGQQPGERNFHVFYQLLQCCAVDSHLASQLQLSADPSVFHFLNQGGPGSAERVSADETSEFAELRSTMRAVHIDESAVFKLLAAVLHLGNIVFVPSGQGDGTKIQEQTQPAIEAVAALLGCDKAQMQNVFLKREFHSQGRKSFYAVSLTPAQAEESRDAMAKFMYSKLFDWVVERTNSSIAGRTNPGQLRSSISVLDIFGFECFQSNSFEQLCINFCNEKLQQQFTQVMMREEQEIYAQELQPGDVPEVFFRDNDAVVSLIESKPTGVLASLDEECRLPRGNNRGFLEKLDSTHTSGGGGSSGASPGTGGFFQRGSRSRATATSPAEGGSVLSQTPYIQERMRPGCFSIRHYAGIVTYDVSGWLDKNRDTVSPDLLTFLRSSCGLPLLQNFFPATKSESSNAAPPGRGGSRGFGSATVSTQFRLQLDSLIASLRGCTLHYVRCIKPNAAKVAWQFDGNFVLQQLRYTGLLETTRLRRGGFLYRKTFAGFLERFGVLLVPPSSALDQQGNRVDDDSTSLLGQQRAMHDTRTLCDEILRGSQTEGVRGYALGRTLVFVRDIFMALIERRRQEWESEVARQQEVFLEQRREAERQRALEAVGNHASVCEQQLYLLQGAVTELQGVVATANAASLDPNIFSVTVDTVSSDGLAWVQQAATNLFQGQKSCEQRTGSAFNAARGAVESARTAMGNVPECAATVQSLDQRLMELESSWSAVLSEAGAALAALQEHAASFQELLEDQRILFEQRAEAQRLAKEEQDARLRAEAARLAEERARQGEASRLRQEQANAPPAATTLRYALTVTDQGAPLSSSPALLVSEAASREEEALVAAAGALSLHAAEGGVLPANIPTAASPAEEAYGRLPVDDDTVCTVCSRGDDKDHMLQCYACEAGYHTSCLSEPLVEIPDGDWLCDDCAMYHLTPANPGAYHNVKRATAGDTTKEPSKEIYHNVVNLAHPASQKEDSTAVIPPTPYETVPLPQNRKDPNYETSLAAGLKWDDEVDKGSLAIPYGSPTEWRVEAAGYEHQKQVVELEKQLVLQQAAEATASQLPAPEEKPQKWGWIRRGRRPSDSPASVGASTLTRALKRTDTESLLALARLTYVKGQQARAPEDLRKQQLSIGPEHLKSQLEAVNVKIQTLQTQYDGVQKMKIVYAAQEGSLGAVADEEDMLKAKIEALVQGRSMIEMQLAELDGGFGKAQMQVFGGSESAGSMGLANAPDLTSSQGQRQAVLTEVLQTERDYVRDLDTLISVYMTPLRLRKIVDAPTLSSIFSNITEINQVNKQFLQDLSAAVATVQRQFASENDLVIDEHALALQQLRDVDPRASYTSSAIGQIGEVFMRMSAFFRVYKLFCANYETALVIVQNLRKHNRAFDAFLLAAEADPRCKQLNLGAFLIKPVQRVCKYPLLLRELIKHTPKDEKPEEYARLMLAAVKIDAIVADVNEGRRESEAKARVLEIQDRIEGITQGTSIVAPARVLLREGQLRFSKHANVKRHKPTEMQIFLFTDLMVVCKRKGAGIGSRRDKGGFMRASTNQQTADSVKREFTLKEQIPLDSGTRVIMYGADGVNNPLYGAFQLERGQSTFTIAPLMQGEASSVTECREWFEEVRRLNREQQRKAALLGTNSPRPASLRSLSSSSSPGSLSPQVPRLLGSNNPGGAFTLQG